MAIEGGVAGSPWTEAEVQAAVDTYFQMLRMQELGQKPNKAEHNRRLRDLLPARNQASIERKHANISAVLNLFGAQTLSGYKPLPNFQRLLVKVVGRTLERDSRLDEAAIRAVETAAEAPLLQNFQNFLVAPPRTKLAVGESRLRWIQQEPIRRDYLERESRNRSLGLSGETLVLEFESDRLIQGGARALAKRIEHVSKTQGDGAGFDILSFELDGTPRFVEVKTTAYDAETPFFVTPNEIGFSRQSASSYHLYRLFKFRRKPQMFILPGAIDSNCLLDPVTFRATVLPR